MMKVWLNVALVALAACAMAGAADPAAGAGEAGKKLTRKERLALVKENMERYQALKKGGQDEVGHTETAALMRDFQLRKKKRRGLLRKKQSDMASILFPGVTPEIFEPDQPIWMYTDLVSSKKTQVPFDFYKLPGCPSPTAVLDKRLKQRKNLGSRLQGVKHAAGPFHMKVGASHGCKSLCGEVKMNAREIKWMRKLVERQYRIHMTLDTLPVLMRSQKLNYAVRGYPVGFKAGPEFTDLDYEEYFLYNHLKFTIAYDQISATEVHITGFDVFPVSVAHEIPEGGAKDQTVAIPTCDPNSPEPVVNNKKTYLPLKVDPKTNSLSVVYSYEIEWKQSPLKWADRWDVYLIGGPDDDIHSFAIVNSLMIVLFLTGAIATIMIRTLRKDIAGYNEMQSLEDAQEETGWKLVHGDVFRPPATQTMLFSVLVGTGAQIGTAFFLTMICAMLKLLNPMKKGQTLTAVLFLYVLSGSVAGYVTARIFKFCDAKAWKQATVLTAAGLPGVLVSLFMVLNISLSIAGAATAVSFLTLLALFALWVCVSTPLVFVGSFIGYKSEKISVPTKTNNISRYIPELPWYSSPPLSCMLGGILPFGSVCIELFFIMSALWLHQIYYMMGFLLAVLVILAATCAEVSVVMCYLQLCSEDHRWWWKSFFNCASAGAYLFLYSLWFLSSRLELVGVLPVVVYLTYMGMISVCFALFCGSVGVLTSFWFNRTIYGALKVD